MQPQGDAEVSGFSDPSARLIAACEEFLDAFVSWEFATHLDAGGGIEVQSVKEAVAGIREERPQTDLLRDRLLQVTHRLAERGFVFGTATFERAQKKNAENWARQDAERRKRAAERPGYGRASGCSGEAG